ncbi:MAG: iron-sulfur cluster repair di-iron protein, ric [Eubacteriales bacterium]|nr:iron-sulfur cluster repair di-iron protein, ric [Eubacteriales bacterium]
MNKRSDYYKKNQQVFQTLKQYVPVVDRVHGENHPEFHVVRQLFEAISDQAASAGSDDINLSDEFSRLREVTGDYTVPDDVCESYEAVYSMLSELDQSYHA